MTLYNNRNWQDWTSKMGGGLTSKYKHSAIFIMGWYYWRWIKSLSG